jgi:hypothetical protein
MIFSLDIRKARKGDCFLIHYGTKEQPRLMLVDGGPDAVYGPHLRPRLDQIRKARKLDDDTPLPIDLLMVSHIDDDHIQGIVELTGELVAAANLKPHPFRIRKLWHNAFEDLLGDNPHKLTASVTASFGAAAVSSEPDIDDEALAPSTAMVLAGVAQGRRLRDDARNQHLRIPINPGFKDRLIVSVQEGQVLDLKDGLKMTIAGPMQPELEKLRKEYADWTKKHEDEIKKEGIPASFKDTSVPNLSSIVALAEVAGKRMLLTGDARGDKILKGLEFVGLLRPGGEMKVDIFKVPHHGSDRDMEPIVFKRIPADHYIFSGNGEHGNPERETLEMLFAARGTKGYTMHFTYPIAKIDEERERNWNKERKKKLGRGKDGGPEWSGSKHSLAALFEGRNVGEGREYEVVGEKAHVIDVGDPLGGAWPLLIQ